MARPYYHSISRLLGPYPAHRPKSTALGGRMLVFSACAASKTRAGAGSGAANKDQTNQHSNKSRRKAPPRPLITISASDGRYQGQWNSDYVLSLRELQLTDLAEDGEKDTDVFVSLSVQKHAGFGFSVDGRVITSFNQKCSCCFASFNREIDATFDVWVLPSSKSKDLQLPDISDPSVIYVKPGSEADLASLVQDTIRLTASVKDTCSESCEKSVPMWQLQILMKREVMTRGGLGSLR